MNDIFTSKFVRFLKTLNHQELKSFGLWLRSPWCSTNKNLIPLLEVMKKYYPQFEDQKLTKEKLSKKVLPKGKFSEKRINNLLSEAHLALQRFLVFQNLAKDQNLQNELQLKEWQQRQQEESYLNAIKTKIEQLEAKSPKQWEDHLSILKYLRLVYHNPNQTIQIYKNNELLSRMDGQMEIMYLLEKAAIINEKIMRNRILKHANFEYQTDLKKWGAVSEGINHLSVNLYKIRFGYSDANMLKSVLQLQKQFFKNHQQLDEKSRLIHQISLTNDVIYLRKKGLVGMNEVLEVYKFGFLSDILPAYGILTPITYSTVLSMSNSLNDFEFSINFIKEKTKHLSVEVRQEAENWAKAHLAYRRGRLEESHKILIEGDFHNFHLKRFSRILTLQVFYDLYIKDDSYLDLIDHYCNSFEKWVQREKLFSEANRKSFLLFIQKCRELVTYKRKIGLTEGSLQNFLSKNEYVEARDWLMEKQAQLLQVVKK